MKRIYFLVETKSGIFISVRNALFKAKTAKLQRKAMVHVHNVTRYRSGHQTLVIDYPILAKTKM